jgi:hypothetical protein
MPEPVVELVPCVPLGLERPSVALFEKPALGIGPLGAPALGEVS